MSEELRGRVREPTSFLGDETLVVCSENGEKIFTGGYHDFFLSPRLVKVIGSLSEEFPAWLCENLGQKATLTIVLRGAKITRNVLLTEVSVSFDDNSWIVCGEILINEASK